MTLAHIVEALSLEVFTPAADLSVDASSGYTGDLLSDVMGNAPGGAVWVTVQTHANVIAVATLRDVAAVVVAGGHRPEPEIAAKAEAESIALLGSSLSAFDLAGRLYEMGLRSA